ILSILITMIIIGILTIIFSNLMKLSGLSEDSVFLVNLIGQNINFKGILFAGVIIGSLGILDDMVVSQISAVEEIKEINLSSSEVFKKAYRIGRSHIGSMTNTLFLAYTGSSLTILLLFSVGGMSFNDILNNNLITVEIFRSLIGAIGLALSMPISTFLAVKYLRVKKFKVKS
ncbi:YibE/F family protein, partial [bacterium]|nr:YibE/F family protein [bacterium]